jgi:hypothetical protein
VGVMGPIGSGLPQFGFPRRFAMKGAFPQGDELPVQLQNFKMLAG